MIHISHRGNVRGVEPQFENSPMYIDQCLAMGYDCEIDLRIKNNAPHLGHDTPDYEVSAEWIRQRMHNLWIHAKDYSALVWLLQNVQDSNYFCHESDRYTLVSNGKIWSHDLTNKMTSDCIVPLLSLESVISYNQDGFYAVCSDYVEETKKKWG